MRRCTIIYHKVWQHPCVVHIGSAVVHIVTRNYTECNMTRSAETLAGSTPQAATGRSPFSFLLSRHASISWLMFIAQLSKTRWHTVTVLRDDGTRFTCPQAAQENKMSQEAVILFTPCHALYLPKKLRHILSICFSPRMYANSKTEHEKCSWCPAS